MKNVFNVTMIVSVLVAMVVYFMFVQPMMTTTPSNGNGDATTTDPAGGRR
tara:strand:- start:518 stop:667 length:150 start_codon:yes stop_codon:yes gene_type:complete